MSIYPKKRKIRKASSGINTDQLPTSTSGSDQKIDDGLKAAESIPVIGAFGKLGNSLSASINGEGTSGGKNAVGDMLGGGHTIKAVMSGRFKEAIPIYGSFAKAKRRKEEVATEKRNAMNRRISDMNAQSNSMFGKLTYEDGGKLNDTGANGEAVQGKAVVLDGKLHKDGGNDVVDTSTGEKVAETEREELLFTRAQTESIEQHIAKYNKTQDEYCLKELGALVKKIVESEMIDYSGKFS